MMHRGSGTMRPPRPSTASLTRKAAEAEDRALRDKGARPATAAQSRGGRRRTPLGDVSNAAAAAAPPRGPRLNMARPSTAKRARESKRSAYKRLGALYGMNSTSDFPKTRGGPRKRPVTAPKQRRRQAKLKTAELQEREKHRYSYWRHDTSLLKQHQLLNNVNPSPRDPKADQNARRRSLHADSWKVGYRNTLGSGKTGAPQVEVDAATGEVRVLPAEPKGWPLDSSMRRPWGPAPGKSAPWQPPLGSVPPGDWPKDPDAPPSPRMHFPWSPPRKGAGTLEPMLGKDGNIRSPGQRKSILARTTPEVYFAMKDEEERTKTTRRRAATARRRRPTTAMASPGGAGRDARRVQFMSHVRAAAEQGDAGGDPSPMRGRIQPKHAAAAAQRRRARRPQSAAPSPGGARLRRAESAPRLHKGASTKGGRRGGGSAHAGRRTPTPVGGRRGGGPSDSTAATIISGGSSSRPRTAGPSRNRRGPATRSASTGDIGGGAGGIRQRPSTAAASPMRSTTASVAGGVDFSPGSGRHKSRPQTAQAGGYRRGVRRNAQGQPQYLRPTTATRTKQLYRTGQWPSGRWKMEYASHFVPMTAKERKKNFHVKHRSEKHHGNPDVISSSSEDELDDDDMDEEGNNTMDAAQKEAASQHDALAKRMATRRRRNREAQMRKRPMVAGQRKPRRRFEQKAMAHFTVLRSAPLKKHHVHEVLGKKLQERQRRCEGREEATAWLLAHPKFRQLKLSRFWKQLKPLALENIEAKMLLDRLKRSASNGNRGLGGMGSVELSQYGDEEIDEGKHGEGAGGGIHPAAMAGHMRVADSTPWLHECPDNLNMWVTRPQFIHHMRILMSLNETHNNLRALNRLFSGFDVDVEDRLNVREFCVVFTRLREEKKRAVWAGKIDVNPIFAEAQAAYRPKQGSGMQVVGRVDHHM